MSKVSPMGSSVWYWCPACEGNHRITTSRWTWNGDLEKPTLNPSVHVNPDGDAPVPVCHHFVRDGKIVYLSDCTHKLAGQTVEMEDFDGGLRT